MAETRIITSEESSCPACGCDTAVVRVRGNAFAATCTRCRCTEIAPMLGDSELRDCFEEHQPAPVTSIMHADRVWERALAGDLSAIQETIDAVRTTRVTHGL